MKGIFKIDVDSKRIFGLDILRALAILFVVFEHGGNFLPPSVKRFYTVFIFDGVSIFFVLSGFLIGNILINLVENSSFNKKVLIHFWVRRWFRTLPNYFLILILLVVLNLVFDPSFSVGNNILYFIFSQNIITAHPAFFPEAWSLSIEEWFYILIPICIFISIRYFKLTARSSIFITAISIILAVTLYRYFKFSSHQITSYGEWDLLFRKQIFTRLDSIMYGVLGAYVHFYFKSYWVKYKKELLYLGILSFLFIKFLSFSQLKPVTGLLNCVFSFSLTALATLFILPYLSNLRYGKGVWFRFFSYISVISYSMYLLNLSIVQFWIIDKLNWNYFNINSITLTVVKYGTFWVLTVLLSTILYKYFEIPTMNLRDRFTHLYKVS